MAKVCEKREGEGSSPRYRELRAPCCLRKHEAFWFWLGKITAILPLDWVLCTAILLCTANYSHFAPRLGACSIGCSSTRSPILGAAKWGTSETSLCLGKNSVSVVFSHFLVRGGAGDRARDIHNFCSIHFPRILGLDSGLNFALWLIPY